MNTKIIVPYCATLLLAAVVRLPAGDPPTPTPKKKKFLGIF